MSGVNEHSSSKVAMNYRYKGLPITCLTSAFFIGLSLSLSEPSWEQLMLLVLGLTACVSIYRQNRVYGPFIELARHLKNPNTQYRDLPINTRKYLPDLQIMKNYLLNSERTSLQKDEYFSEFIHMAKELSKSASMSSE